MCNTEANLANGILHPKAKRKFRLQIFKIKKWLVELRVRFHDFLK